MSKPPKKFRWQVRQDQFGNWLAWSSPYRYVRCSSEKEAKRTAKRLSWKDYVA